MKTEYKHKFASIILAAGKGVRMRSDLPKVLHKIAGTPMISHVLQSLSPLKPEKTVVVVSPQNEAALRAAIADTGCQFATQDAPRGTGHAVLAAQAAMAGYNGTTLILYADTPLLTADTLSRVLEAAASADVVVLGMRPQNPTGYGRLVVDAEGQLEEIIEEKDATPEQKKSNLCNSGVMAVNGKHLFHLLEHLEPHNAAGEYYLTDIVAQADAHNLHCHVVEADTEELMGINSREQLAEAEQALQQRLRRRAMEKGATLIDPQSVYLSSDTKIGQDVIIHPQVIFGPGVVVENGVEIRSFSHIEGAHIKAKAIIGPFARLRPGSVIGEEAHVGNFVELKKTNLGKGAKANHLSYVGDADVGEGANIGAGTITCNYDGINKHKTTIGAQAFIGSNTSLVAPVTVGAGAIVGAGSVITQDVEADALALERNAQVNKSGKAKELKAKQRKA